MFLLLNECRLELVQGDITTQHVDALVNAANSELAGGGGVDGAIHRMGGPSIMRETERLYPQGCPTGEAVLTTAGRLPAKAILHAVGPIWRGGVAGEAEQLASAYQACFRLARERDFASLAFPALSLGAYGYPRDLGAEIALRTAREELMTHQKPQLVRFVLFDAGTYGAFARVLEEWLR